MSFATATVSLALKILNAALTIAGLGFVIWLVVRSIKRTADPTKLILKWVFTIPFVIFCVWMAGQMGPFGPFLIVFMAVVMSIMWTPHIGELISKPITSLYDGGDEEIEPKPYYSIAISKRKLRKSLEAIVEIRKQLDKFPNDFEGIMLLATIQAEDMKDLPSAEITLNHFCDAPGAPPRQVSAALTQLADWHLNMAQDVDSARGAFEKIIKKNPGGDIAAAAALRIAHLEGAGKIFLEARDRRPVPVPEGVKSAGLRDSMSDLVPQETAPETLAAEYVAHLEQHPLDTEAREKLAVIYANHYKRLDLAAGELNQLAAMPEQPVRRAVHWLNLLADLQIQHGADHEAVSGTLQQIIGRFPGLPAAEQARSRLDHLALELKSKTETPTKKIGVYEQNIGLKRGSPR